MRERVPKELWFLMVFGMLFAAAVTFAFTLIFVVDDESPTSSPEPALTATTALPPPPPTLRTPLPANSEARPEPVVAEPMDAPDETLPTSDGVPNSDVVEPDERPRPRRRRANKQPRTIRPAPQPGPPPGYTPGEIFNSKNGTTEERIIRARKMLAYADWLSQRNQRLTSAKLASEPVQRETCATLWRSANIAKMSYGCDALRPSLARDRRTMAKLRAQCLDASNVGIPVASDISLYLAACTPGAVARSH